MAETSLDAFKAKDSEGLYKLCSVLEGIQEPFVIFAM